MSWLGKATKSLFIFSFFLSWTYYIEESIEKCYITSVMSHMIGSHSITSHDGSHDKCGKVVHRPCSGYISSIGKFNRDSIEFYKRTSRVVLSKFWESVLLVAWWQIMYCTLTIPNFSCLYHAIQCLLIYNWTIVITDLYTCDCTCNRLV